MDSKVKRAHTDNAPKFLSMKKELGRMGIHLTCSFPYIPQSNGLAERMNRTLLEKARSLLMESGVNSGYWGQAVMHAADLYNRAGIEGQGMRTPHELFLKL